MQKATLNLPSSGQRLADQLGADFRHLAMDTRDLPPGYGVTQLPRGVDMGMDQLATGIGLVGIVEQALPGSEFQPVEIEMFRL